MRFSLCDPVSQEHPLPLLLNDLFVHFGEKRISSVTEKLAEAQQLIMLTCHLLLAVDMLEEGITCAKQLILCLLDEAGHPVKSCGHRCGQ